MVNTLAWVFGVVLTLVGVIINVGVIARRLNALMINFSHKRVLYHTSS